MRITRRNFFQAALAMPIGASLSRFEAWAAPDRGKIKITAIKAMQAKDAGTLIRIETDAGITGYGPCGVNGPFARNVIAGLEGGRHPNLGLIGKDPLAIKVHFQNMFYTVPQRGRQIRVYSGIDIALWDLAGKILGAPVSKLLGGNFRDEIPLYSHTGPRDSKDPLNKQGWRDVAQSLKDDPRGFKAYKIDIHHPLGGIMQQYVPNLGPAEIRRIATYYALAREAFGSEIDIIAHCHNELDLPSAIRAAEVIEPIKPLWFEDPIGPEFSDSWIALRRTTRIPIMTGENIEMLEGAMPFLQHQVVDCLQPDLVNSGGITGTKMIADLASAYRIPICLHNVSGLALNMASQQFSAAIFNCPRLECVRNADKAPAAASNAPVIKNGRILVSTLPGLGLDLNQDYLKSARLEGEPWWD